MVNLNDDFHNPSDKDSSFAAIIRCNYDVLLKAWQNIFDVLLLHSEKAPKKHSPLYCMIFRDPKLCQNLIAWTPAILDEDGFHMHSVFSVLKSEV